LGGAFGYGLFENIKQAYRFIVNNYENGDKIVLFGFSRGAYTARSLASMIARCGILRKKYISDVDTIFKFYKNKKLNEEFLKDYTSNFCHPEREVLFLGVWDTVGALGIPLRILKSVAQLFTRITKGTKLSFHTVSLSEHVKNAYHALAVDEHRRQFAPTLWKQSNIQPDQNVEQRWFAGSHSNIGGGFADAGLSNITLHWMLGKLKDCMPDISLDDGYIATQKMDECGEFRGDFSWVYIDSKIIKHIRKTNDPKFANQSIDETVYQRMKCENIKYTPRNIERKTG
jgi:uncharacterized protein (DUF2235 family)